MAAERADPQRAVAVLAVVAEAGQVVDVDEQRGGGEAQLEQRHEALAAREHLGVVAVLGEQRDRLVEGARRRVAEAGGVHASSGPSTAGWSRLGPCGSGTATGRSSSVGSGRGSWCGGHGPATGWAAVFRYSVSWGHAQIVGLFPVFGAFSISSYMRLFVIRGRLLARVVAATVHVFAARRPWSISERLRGLVLAPFRWSTMGAHVGRAMQVPAPFEYRRATSVEHAIALLVRHGPETRLVAGRPQPPPDDEAAAGGAGAARRHQRAHRPGVRHGGPGRAADRGAHPARGQLLAAPAVGDVAPVLHDAERSIADAIVRNRGTVGGSVCQADPSEDLSGAFCALRAEAVIRGAAGHPHGADAGVLPRALPDGGGARRDARGAAGAAVGHGQRVRQGRPAGGGLGGRRGRRRAPRRRRRDHRRRDRPHRRRVRSSPRRPRRACSGGRRPRRRSPRPGGSPRSTAVRAPTSAGPSTTSATWRASSPCGRCAGRKAAA